jgi:hypothetical protein
VRELLGVVRIQLVNWRYGYGMPLAILAMVLGINLALFATIGDAAPPEGRTTGAVMSIYIVFGVGYLQVITQSFPFALGLGVTRRAFYAGTALLAAVEALGFGALVLLLSALERATGGWGIGLRFFLLDFLVVDHPLLQWLVYAVPFAALSALGIFTGVVFKRWGQVGVYATTLVPLVALSGAAVLVTWMGWWPELGGWFAGQTTTALFAGYPLVLALLLGGAGWLAIRRATP